MAGSIHHTSAGSIEPALGFPPAAPAEATAALRPLVLAVDDDVVQRAMLGAVLRNAGFDVVLAADVEVALSIAITVRPDVVVTDALMPGSSGLDLLDRLQAGLGNVHVPTIVVSGSDDVATRLDAFEHGADDFVAKPYTPAELVARVHAQIRSAERSAAQTQSVLSDLRSARSGVQPQPGVDTATRSDRAHDLFAQRPAALSCAALAILDERGRVEWVPRPALVDWNLLHPATSGLGPANPSVDIEAGPDHRCPVCGAMGEGRIFLTAAGRWSGGAAHLLVGCQSPARRTHRLLAEELADSIAREIGDMPDDHFADIDARAWIDRVIAERAYHFVFQPIVTITTGRVVGYEALARFDDGRDVLDVLDGASRAGRRVHLELALVEGALRAATVFAPGTWIHVNLSPLAALAPELPAFVAASSQHIVLEITENALFDAAGATSLRASLPPSCRLAIDDVGAGWSGLSRLLEVRPDIVKIDRSVIAGIDHDPARQALVAGLVQFGCVTDAMVIAEGIEHELERDVLRTLGVHFAQGYLFALPGPHVRD